MCTFVAGFSVAFGSLFAKTWRVHAILTTKKLKRNVGMKLCCIPIANVIPLIISILFQVISDSRLIGLVSVLVLINALIITVWQAIDPYTVVSRNLTSTVSQIHVQCMCVYFIALLISVTEPALGNEEF